jgi:mannose-6-phosphate isomerase-like protein (cupin superfamily)
MGKIKPFFHEDERRIMAEYIEDIPMRSSKVIFMKKDAEVGNHWHELKDEVFFLLKGSGTYKLDGKVKDFKEGDCIFVKRGTTHTLNLKQGSIVLESSTMPYTKQDEHASL